MKYEIVKIALFETLDLPNLFSRKIWVAKKFLDFHSVKIDPSFEFFGKASFTRSNIASQKIPLKKKKKMDLIGKKAFYTQQSRVPPYFVPFVSLFWY